jgi:hypothetical protein
MRVRISGTRELSRVPEENNRQIPAGLKAEAEVSDAAWASAYASAPQ